MDARCRLQSDTNWQGKKVNPWRSLQPGHQGIEWYKVSGHHQILKKCGISNVMDGTEDNAIFEQSDSSDDDDEYLAGILKGLTPVDISDECNEEFNDFYDE